MTIIRLGYKSLYSSSNLPGFHASHAYIIQLTLNNHETLFGLAPGGVYPAITVTSNPVRSYRTLSALPVLLLAIGGLLSAALVVGLRRPGVTWHPAHWSPDFPPPTK